RKFLAPLTRGPGPVILKCGHIGEDPIMFKRIFAVAVLAVAGQWALSDYQAGGLKSGAQVGEKVAGGVQADNGNRQLARPQHCLVCEFRLNPVALVFVRAAADGVDPEVKKLVENLDRLVAEHHDDTGLESFVVFLTPKARSGVTEERSGDPKNIIDETANREKLIRNLEEFAKPIKRLVVTCYPAENIADRYKLDNKAEVTVLLYARHRVFSNYAFAEGQLNQEAIDKIGQGVESMLERLKKSPLQFKDEKGK